MGCATEIPAEVLEDLTNGLSSLLENNYMASAVMLAKAIIADGHKITIEADEDEVYQEECELRGRIKREQTYNVYVNDVHAGILQAVSRGSFSRINGEYEWHVRSEWEYDGEYLADAVGVDVKMPDIPCPTGWWPA